MTSFLKNRYAIVNKLLDSSWCDFATRYAFHRKQFFDQTEGESGQVPHTTAVYGDTFMETLMETLKDKAEEVTGLELCPSYTYYRIYRPGDSLARHSDREPCEISMTVCLGQSYGVDSSIESWPIYVDPESHNSPNDFKSAQRTGLCVELGVGDALFYRGCELEHWREPLIASDGSYLVQLFVHYLDKNGPYYPEFAYDRRPGIGAPDSLRSDSASLILISRKKDFKKVFRVENSEGQPFDLSRFSARCTIANNEDSEKARGVRIPLETKLGLGSIEISLDKNIARELNHHAYTFTVDLRLGDETAKTISGKVKVLD